MKILSRYVDSASLKTYYSSYILPLMDYCCIIWGRSRNHNVEQVAKLQKRAARLILRADITTSSKDMFKSLKWMSFRDRIEYHTCVMVYKTLNNLTPEYITDLLSNVSNSHSQQLRSETRNMLRIPRSHTASFDNSFSVTGPSAWNKLPIDVKSSPSLAAFKDSLTRHIFSQT